MNIQLRIIFSELWTFSLNLLIKKSKIIRRPITDLRMTDTATLRGRFEIYIGDRQLSIPGWGSHPDDIMIDSWLYSLTRLYEDLEAGAQSHIVNTYEQGCPDYLFEREGDMLYLSLNESIVDGHRYEDWQRVPMTYESFQEGFRTFRRALYEELKNKAPEGYLGYFKEDLPLDE